MSNHVERLESAVADLRTVAAGLRIPLDTSAVDRALKDLVESLKPSKREVRDFSDGKVADLTEKAEKPRA